MYIIDLIDIYHNLAEKKYTYFPYGNMFIPPILFFALLSIHHEKNKKGELMNDKDKRDVIKSKDS